MSIAMRHVMRAIVKGAIGLSPTRKVGDVLEDRLFSELLPESDAGNVPKEAVDVLLDLYQRLVENEQPQTAWLSAALHQLIDIPGVPETDPIGVIAFMLHEIALGGQLTGSQAERLARLPWRAAAKAISKPISKKLTGFADLLGTFAHEVEEGFVESVAYDGRLYEELRQLSNLLCSLLACGTESTAN